MVAVRSKIVRSIVSPDLNRLGTRILMSPRACPGAPGVTSVAPWVLASVVLVSTRPMSPPAVAQLACALTAEKLIMDAATTVDNPTMPTRRKPLILELTIGLLERQNS